MKKNYSLTAVVEREGDGYVSLCPELDVASQGDTVEEVLRFVQNVIAYTQSLALLREECFLTENTGNKAPSLTWHGVRLYAPDWAHHSHSLAFEVYPPDNHEHLHVMFNAYWEPLTFTLPTPRNGMYWRRIIDTTLPAPDDFCAPDIAPIIEGGQYTVMPRSVVVLAGYGP